MEQTVIDIHPYDFAEMLNSAKPSDQIVFRDDGLVEFNNIVFNQTTQIPRIAWRTE